ncbi:coagulation factor 5/8 type domain-containing protein [Galbibacter marinus]|uniref:Coagulation factor 5/8 type domain-containing protein n=2 Tax=Galbibacter marinus TaxID=555500 RepID=K2NZF2_9FLAO|nr:coagulation factor 5/8 type domain-containing protein [Galbibacter marinus]
MRSFDKTKVIKSEDLKVSTGYQEFYLEIVPTLEYDYCFSNKEGVLILRVKNKRAMLFVTYQLMASIGETDQNFTISDLPPSFISFGDQCRRFDFEYREPHLEPNTNPEYAGILGTNNLDENWGLWGHNLHKLIVANQEIYAQVNGVSNKQQYCFSSNALYKQLKHYVEEQFGDGTKKPYWFMVAPNDNDLVCVCDQCSKLGNTDQLATPAVGYLLNKLADHYPEHHFFTIAYRTTREAPRKTWATNTGVFFTSIDLPKGINLEGHPKFSKWEKELKNWIERVSKIYLWGYISNFDDYLSPLPVLKGFQQQIPSFKSAGVKGLFLNGSGYDYSPFDDVKTYVLSALMIDKDSDVDVLVHRYLKKFYPKSSALLANYYLQLEDHKMTNNRPWPLYGSFDNIVKTYLNTEQFVSFYNSLKVMVNQSSGEEYLRLDKLITALSFTRLQVAYHEGLGDHGGFEKTSDHLHVKPEIKEIIERLKRHGRFSDMANYREVRGGLLTYIEQWEDLVQHGLEPNMLSQSGISFVSVPDHDYQDASILYDGLSGFTYDYHQGWVINGGEVWELSMELPSEGKGNVLEMRFLNMSKHGILSPEQVEITNGSQVLYTLVPTKISETVYRIRTEVDFSENTKAVQIRIFKKKQGGKSTIALDEVRLIK